jgi:hypothetical protein
VPAPPPGRLVSSSARHDFFLAERCFSAGALREGNVSRRREQGAAYGEVETARKHRSHIQDDALHDACANSQGATNLKNAHAFRAEAAYAFLYCRRRTRAAK